MCPATSTGRWCGAWGAFRLHALGAYPQVFISPTDAASLGFLRKCPLYLGFKLDGHTVAAVTNARGVKTLCPPGAACCVPSGAQWLSDQLWACGAADGFPAHPHSAPSGLLQGPTMRAKRLGSFVLHRGQRSMLLALQGHLVDESIPKPCPGRSLYLYGPPSPSREPVSLEDPPPWPQIQSLVNQHGNPQLGVW